MEPKWHPKAIQKRSKNILIFKSKKQNEKELQHKPFRARTGSALRWRDLLRPSKHLLFMNFASWKKLAGHLWHISSRERATSKKDWQNPENPPQSTPNPPKIDPPTEPRSIQNRLRRPSWMFIGFGSIFSSNRSQSDRPRPPQDHPKITPRPPQDRPRPPQGRPKTALRPPRIAPRAPKTAPRPP